MECRPYSTYAVYDAKRWRLFWLLPLVQLALSLIRGGPVTLPLRETLLALVLTIYSVCKWRTCRYHLAHSSTGRFHSVGVRQGILVRHALHVSADEAASIEVERTPLLWLLGGRRIRINTAGLRRRSDAVLYLTAAQTRQLFSLRTKGIRRTRAHWWPVAMMSLSGSNAAVGLLTAAPVLRQAGRLLGEQFSQDVATAVGTFLTTGLPPLLQLVANLLIFGWALSALRNFLRYVGFYAQREDEHLHLVSGLFTRRDVLIDCRKITALELRQTLVMRLLDLNTAVITAAGYGRDVGARPVLIPAARPRTLCACLDLLLPEYPVQVSMVSLRGRGRYLFWPFFWLLAGMGLWAGGGLWRAGAVLWTIGCGWWLVIRLLGSFQAGFGINEQAVALCYPRGLALYRVFLPRSVTDCITVTQSVFQRRRGTCTVQVRCFGEKRRRHRVWGLPYDSVCQLLET